MCVCDHTYMSVDLRRVGGGDRSDPCSGREGDRDGVLCCAGESHLHHLLLFLTSPDHHLSVLTFSPLLSLPPLHPLFISLSPSPPSLSLSIYLSIPPLSQMTTLEAVDSSESLAAVAYLLNLVLKRSDTHTYIQQCHTCSGWCYVMCTQTHTHTHTHTHTAVSSLLKMVLGHAYTHTHTHTH